MTRPFVYSAELQAKRAKKTRRGLPDATGYSVVTITDAKGELIARQDPVTRKRLPVTKLDKQLHDIDIIRGVMDTALERATLADLAIGKLVNPRRRKRTVVKG